MKSLTRLWPVLCAALIILSCRKDTSTTSEPRAAIAASITRVLGVVPDDPAKISKVPTIVSEDFLSRTANNTQVTVNTTVLPAAALPTTLQLAMPPVADQGGEGACVPFAVAYAARSVEQFYKTNAPGYDPAKNIFSPEFVYNQTRVGDCGSGTSVTAVLDFLVNKGVCSWQSMPYSYSNGCSQMPAATQTAEAAAYKIASYSKLFSSDVTAIKTMVLKKHAVIITITTDESFWRAQPGFTWKSYNGTPGILHSIVICGYDDARNAFKIMNSWGAAWADQGYTWIDYQFLTQCALHYSYVINH